MNGGSKVRPMTSNSRDLVVVVGGVRGFVRGGRGGRDGFLLVLHGVSVCVVKESPTPPRHRPWPLQLPTLLAERCETSTFSLRRRHLPILLPAPQTTTQHPSLRERP